MVELVDTPDLDRLLRKLFLGIRIEVNLSA